MIAQPWCYWQEYDEEGEHIVKGLHTFMRNGWCSVCGHYDPQRDEKGVDK